LKLRPLLWFQILPNSLAVGIAGIADFFDYFGIVTRRLRVILGDGGADELDYEGKNLLPYQELKRLTQPITP
jgi:hypothetical protein